MEKEKFTIEYPVRNNISGAHIWQYFHTEDGLSAWFADKVLIRNGMYEFFWGDSSQQAKLIHNTALLSARYHWLEDEEDASYFQFKLERNEITQVVTLVITDFAYPEDKQDSINLWNTQIENLRRTIGL